MAERIALGSVGRVRHLERIGVGHRTEGVHLQVERLSFCGDGGAKRFADAAQDVGLFAVVMSEGGEGPLNVHSRQDVESGRVVRVLSRGVLGVPLSLIQHMKVQVGRRQGDLGPHALGVDLYRDPALGDRLFELAVSDVVLSSLNVEVSPFDF